MRTIRFKTVLDAVLRRLGLDPDDEHLKHDTVRAVAEHIQERARTGWDYYDWPELTVTAERALRDVWFAGTTYQAGAEVFYFPTRSYYRATAATSTTPGAVGAEWAPTTITDRYLSLSQAGGLAIGTVLGVSLTDPRTTHGGRAIGFRPSEEGIDLDCSAGATGTVWVTFQRRAPLFSAVAFAPGKAYLRGNVVYDPVSGECFRALAPNSDDTLESRTHWLLQPFPYFLSVYAKAGAYAGCLREIDQANQSADQMAVRMKLAAAADNEAEESLQREMDRLQAQGDHRFYRPFGGQRAAGPQSVTFYPVYFPVPMVA